MNALKSRRRNRRNELHSRSGFMLVLTLAMIVVAALMTALIARRSLALASEAAVAREELQIRWGRVSIARAVLGNAEPILTSGTHDNSAPKLATSPREKRGIVTLGGVSFDVALADEDAKANLNAIHDIDGSEAVISAIQALTGTKSGLRCRLRPFELTGDSDAFPVFDSWGQVFDLGQGRAGGESDESKLLQLATSEITCWGAGRLNIRRCSEKALQRVCRLELTDGDAEQLLKLPVSLRISARSVGDWLSHVPLDVERRGRLTDLLAADSSCYSLWLRAPARRGSDAELHVLEIEPAGRRHLLSFSW